MIIIIIIMWKSHAFNLYSIIWWCPNRFLCWFHFFFASFLRFAVVYTQCGSVKFSFWVGIYLELNKKKKTFKRWFHAFFWVLWFSFFSFFFVHYWMRDNFNILLHSIYRCIRVAFKSYKKKLKHFHGAQPKKQSKRTMRKCFWEKSVKFWKNKQKAISLETF